MRLHENAKRAPRAIASPYKGTTGMRRLRNALRYSIEGILAACRHEDAFRVELVLAGLLIPLAFVMPVTGVGKALMVLSVLLVLIVELVNSALEAVTDRVSLASHELSKRAKDMGSAAVMVSLVAVPITWLLVLFG